MCGKWMCFVILDLVILTYSSPERFYHDYHTSYDNNPWNWGHGWQQTTKSTRRKTTTARVETTSKPVPTLPLAIRDVDTRVGEMTAVVSSTPSPRPITLIQEEIPFRVKEQHKAPQAESFESAAIGTLGSAENSQSKPMQTPALNEDETPEAGFAPGLENNPNSFGVAVVGDDVEAANNFEIKPEKQATSFTRNEGKPQSVTGPKDTGAFQIAVISTIDADTEAEPAKTETPSNENFFVTVPGDSKEHLASIHKVLEAIRGTDNGKVTDHEAPLLNEKQSMWHVAIYEKKKGRFEHICGGSLIKADIVISAGHCLWSPVRQVLPTTMFRVAAGKLYPRYDDPRDTTAQHSGIRNISISDMEELCMQPDLAILNLVVPFKYTSAVKPVCFSLDWALSTRQLREGNVGTIASWAVVENGACRPQQHTWLSLPFVNKKVYEYEGLYKTTGRDRICAGQMNDTTECAIDSGNGLVFYQDKIPYLRGVATNLPVHRECARFHTRSFTNIIDFRGIPREYFKGITDVYNLGECENIYKTSTIQYGGQKNETNNKFGILGDGFVQVEPPTKEPDDQVFTAQGIGAKPAPTLPGTSAPALQWHVGVYSTLWAPYMQICGGSLVKRDFVISAAHCFWDDAAGQLPASQFAVAGGKLFRPWNNTQDTYAQHSDISEIILPIRFRGGATSFQDDIAVLQLATPFTYAPGVQSVCVDFHREFETRQLQPGNMGTILGWGLTEKNGSPSQRLTYLELPYVDVDDCFADSEPAFLKYITGDKICAGDTVSGKALCRGDSGGGFVLYSNSTPHIHGVASTAAGNENLCNAFTLGTFTSIYAHRAFLRDNVPGIDKECVKPETTDNRKTGVGDTRVGTEAPVYTNVPYFPYPNHFVCNCNCKP